MDGQTDGLMSRQTTVRGQWSMDKKHSGAKFFTLPKKSQRSKKRAERNERRPGHAHAFLVLSAKQDTNRLPSTVLYCIIISGFRLLLAWIFDVQLGKLHTRSSIREVGFHEEEEHHLPSYQPATSTTILQYTT